MSRSPWRVLASERMASACVWSTAASGMKAWSSVSMEGRGAFGSRRRRSRNATIASSRIARRAESGRSAASGSGAKWRASQVFRSAPLAFTQSTS